MHDGLPLALGDTGEAVSDLQRRLAGAGFTVTGERGRFAATTTDAVLEFQQSRGLHGDGVCGPQTWAALVEAGYRLGDRFVYLTSPMLRGDDVADLQHRLGALGFDAGRVDGIFGPDGAGALKEFQRNAGLTIDGICGSATVAALARLLRRQPTPGSSVATVREAEDLRSAPRHLTGRRIVIGESGGLSVLAEGVRRAVAEAGAEPLVLHHPDGSAQAQAANRFEAEVYLGLALDPAPVCRAAYFAATGFESVGGRRLAELVIESLAVAINPTGPDVRGMRLPILRETRMPAVVCTLGPADDVVGRIPQVTVALERALSSWGSQPIGR